MSTEKKSGNKPERIVLPIAGSNEKFEINPSKIIAVGLNYVEHVEESSNNKIPAEPILFALTNNSLTGPGEPIVIPAHIKDYQFPNERVDHEVELALIIGKRGRHIPLEEAYDYVYGYTIFNDVSQRNIQMSDASGWFRGKSFDTFSPIGPVVVLHKDIGDPMNLKLTCKVNGVVKQSTNTNMMIFSIPVLISFISKQFTLEEGDIIVTGTCAGVSPIVPGDTVELEIERIGILSNPVIAE
jgi:2-keto-4-pentenoate hydratase/2-oxohepta-3-ene-1,7-dioic acid hydratase in catechol pathway